MGSGHETLPPPPNPNHRPIIVAVIVACLALIDDQEDSVLGTRA